MNRRTAPQPPPLPTSPTFRRAGEPVDDCCAAPPGGTRGYENLQRKTNLNTPGARPTAFRDPCDPTYGPAHAWFTSVNRRELTERIAVADLPVGVTEPPYLFVPKAQTALNGAGERPGIVIVERLVPKAFIGVGAWIATRLNEQAWDGAVHFEMHRHGARGVETATHGTQQVGQRIGDPWIGYLEPRWIPFDRVVMPGEFLSIRAWITNQFWSATTKGIPPSIVAGEQGLRAVLSLLIGEGSLQLACVGESDFVPGRC